MISFREKRKKRKEGKKKKPYVAIISIYDKREQIHTQQPRQAKPGG